MLGPIVLYSWPIVVLVLFRIRTPATALLAAIIAGYLFLPTQLSIEAPGLPSLNKYTIPSIAAFLGVLLLADSDRKRLRPGWAPMGAVPLVLGAALFTSAFLMVMTNGDVLIYGHLVFPALRPWDAFSTILSTFFAILPMLLGRKLLAGPRDHALFLKALVIAGAVYSLLALYEVRMSPQLNNMVYGFFPHEWIQHIRASGFRPVVFLHHGLWLSIFFAATVVAAFGIAKYSREGKSAIAWGLSLWLLMTLVASKSMGALIITLTLIPSLLFLKPRMHIKIGAILALVVLLYPMLRGADLIPVDRILEWVQGVNEERARSLAFRLRAEDALLEKAQGRPVFGWGGWGRNFAYSDTGEGISLVADGYWVLVVGIGGWARYLAEFGLLCLPVVLLAIKARAFNIGWQTTVLALVLVSNLIDLIPNATMTPLTWLLAGALWGRLELGQIADTDADPVAAAEAAPDPTGLRPSKPARPRPVSAGPTAPARQAASPSREATPYTRQTTRIVRGPRRPEGSRS